MSNVPWLVWVWLAAACLSAVFLPSVGYDNTHCFTHRSGQRICE